MANEWRVAEDGEHTGVKTETDSDCVSLGEEPGGKVVSLGPCGHNFPALAVAFFAPSFCLSLHLPSLIPLLLCNPLSPLPSLPPCLPPNGSHYTGHGKSF